MKLSKKIISILLSVIVAFGSLAIGGDGFSNVFDSFTVKASAARSGICGDNVTWSLSDDGVLTISGKGSMYDYIYSDIPWRGVFSSICYVKIEKDITGIDDDSFTFGENIKNYTVDKENNNFSNDENGILFNKSKTELISYPHGNKRQSYTIPNGVINIADSAFVFCNNLVEIKIPDETTIIGGAAFEQCKNLKNVNLPDSITSIGAFAFNQCPSLLSIDLPSNISTIERDAFSECTSLRTVTFPDNLEIIGSHAFSDCKSLSNIIIPSRTSIIGDSAFYDCTSLESVTILGNLNKIGSDAFSGCTSLTDISINNAEIIGDYAFHNCSSLQEISIPKNVISIGQRTFSGCTLLKTIKVDDNNQQYSSDKYGVLFNKDKTELINCPCKSENVNYIIPNTVTIIRASAFSNCDNLISITIPSGVTSIGEFAFGGCSNLSIISVDHDNTVYDSRNNCNAVIETKTNTIIFGCKNTIIPDSVTSIGTNAFEGCTGLTSITIPDSVTSIERLAFYNCSGLTNATLSKNITTIGFYAFGGCNGLTSITIPDSVTSIGDGAFDIVNNISYSENMKAIGSPWDAKCANGYIDGNLVYSDSSKTTLCGCSSSANGSITIPNSVTTINSKAFFGCTSLTSIILPNSITTINDFTFSGCTGLTSMTIPDSVTSIGGGAFDNCSGLTSMVIPDSVTSIGGGAFEDCTDLTSIIIPNSITTISNHLVYGCTGLTSIILPDSIITIDSHAFRGCTGLTSLIIPDSVTKIDICAFFDCYNLKYVHIPASVTDIYNTVFNTTTTYICSDTDDCYAKTYAEKNNITFKVCTDHSNTDYFTTITDNKTGITISYEPSAFDEEVELICEICDPAFIQSSPGTFTLSDGRMPTTVFKIFIQSKLYKTPVQPTTPVFVSIPAKTTPYLITHISDDLKSIEQIKNFTYSDNAVHFKTGSFSYFAIFENVYINNSQKELNVDYRAKLTFNADAADVDENNIHWFVNGIKKGTGSSYTIDSAVEKEYTIQVKVIVGGEIISESETETVKVKTNFFAKLIAFFRNLFGKLPEYVDNIKVK